MGPQILLYRTSNLDLFPTILIVLFCYLCSFICHSNGSSDTLYFEVKENSPPHAYIGRIPLKSGFQYRFNEEPLEFHLDTEKGILMTTDVPLDRETKSLYSFVILSSSPAYPIQVKIRVLDLNDNVPYWPNYINKNLTFSESAPIGTKVILENAIDLDESELYYKIDFVSDTNSDEFNDIIVNDKNNDYHHNNIKLPFRLNYNQSTRLLHLEVSDRLDRELRSDYLLNITAFDEDQQSSSTIFQVRILDSNDNPPIFEQNDYTITLNESIGKDVPILKVKAFDSDEDGTENSRISYSLQSEDFKIDPKSGIISTVHDGPFRCGISTQNTINKHQNEIDGDDDVDYQRVCVFTVFASDHGVPRQDGRAYVTAKIQDINNHVPVIRFRYFSRSDFAHVDENANNGSVVAAISIIDLDQGPNGQTRLEIISGNELKHFRLESIGNSHIIKVNSVLNREETSSYNLTVRAWDHGTPSKSSTANLIIIVQDHNDHGPQFDQEIYETSLIENQSKIGLFVIIMHASDQDEGINSQIFYSISGPNSHYFKIDQSNGMIVTDKFIDRESIDSFELRVTARDGGSNPKWTNAILRIKVLDINDQTPTVELLPIYRKANSAANEYELSIDEDQSLELDLIINDNDLDNNGTVDVRILHNYDGMFFIDRETKKLRSKRKLDYEQCDSYRIVLLASDRAPIEQRLSSITTIWINVNNIDDQLPSLLGRRYYSFIPINAVGMFNYSVVINKLKIRNEFNVPMHFIVHSRDEVVRQLFYINNNGEMRFKNSVNARLLRNIPKFFSFEIDCPGCRPDFNQTIVNVFLIDDENDDSESFDLGKSKQIYNFSVFENAPIGFVLGELNVPIEHFDLYLIQGDLHQQFQFDRNQLRLQKQLDYERKSAYKLQAIAIQSETNQFFHIDIQIDVVDINDCLAKFSDPFKVISINEDVPSMYALMQIKTIDPDSNSVLNQNEYEIIENPLDLLFIDENELKLSSSLMNVREVYQTSEFYPFLRAKIRSFDRTIIETNQTDRYDNYGDGDDRKCFNEIIQTIFIEIRPIAKKLPRFAKKFYEIFLLESWPVNERFFKIEIDNLDENERFSLKISNENSDNFAILPSGHLFVRNVLDRELIQVHVFDVIIEDNRNDLNETIDSCQIVIRVKDVNDNKPQFESSFYRFDVPEEISTSFFIGQVRATDKDSGLNSQIAYSLVSSYYSSYLNIDPSTGYLWTDVPYDREVMSFFEVVVQATDQSIDEDRLTSQAVVHINVLDLNDNRPIFKIPSNVTVVLKDEEKNLLVGEIFVLESMEVGSTVVCFEAIDYDNESTISFKVIDPSEIVSIDSKSGIVTLMQSLDRETKDHYEFTVEAYDGKYRSYFQLNLLVEDVNDCKPIWLNFSTNQFDVPENTPIGSEILSLDAIDSDLGQNALFHFTIENYSGQQKLFDILNQKLIVINQLDFEKTKSHQLNISLIETSSNQIASTKTIQINLLDINDCHPMFLSRSETEVVKVSENTEIGTKLLLLQAYDCDQNDTLSYEIISCNTHYHTSRNIFQYGYEPQHKRDSNNCPLKLNSKTGEIININNLDREVIESINLKINVKDQIGHFDRMKVIFLIDDINDESPVFVSPNKIIISRYSADRAGSFVGQIKAVDLDLGVNSMITYRLEPTLDSHLFELDRFSGRFLLKQPSIYIDKDYQSETRTFMVNVSAEDGGGLKTYDSIEFIVEPEGKPYLESLEIIIDINENLPLGTEIGKLDCINQYNGDRDYRNGCRFHLINATDRDFDIDTFSGAIKVADLIDREMLDRRFLTAWIIGPNHLQIVDVSLLF